MDLDFTRAEEAFRQEVRAFIAARYPAALRTVQASGEPLGREDYLAWHRILARRGWVAPGWPIEHGDVEFTPVEKFILAEELALADTIPVLPFGLKMVAPVILTFGTAEQKARFLPPTLAGDLWWCQGYSEPGAGSDLASLGTGAVRDGDHYVVNGQKTWTSYARFADWGFFLVRTDAAAKPQQGISFLLIDMTSPGITVRPIVTLDGGCEANEVWLENVRVPVANRVHEENQGWTCAKFLLAHERTEIAQVARSKRGLQTLRRIAAAEGIDANPRLRVASARARIYRATLARSRKRRPRPRAGIVAAQDQGHRTPAAPDRIDDGSGGTLRAAARDCAGQRRGIGPDYAGRAAPTYFNMRKVSIFGGSNEIQRNIIAKAVLRL